MNGESMEVLEVLEEMTRAYIHGLFVQAERGQRRFAEAVHPLYQVLGWKWARKSSLEVPTVDDIVDEVVMLLRHTRRQYDDNPRGEKFRCSCGGLDVSLEVPRNGIPVLRVGFVADWNIYDPDVEFRFPGMEDLS